VGEDARPERVREGQRVCVMERDAQGEWQSGGGRAVFMDVEKAARLTRGRLTRSGER
jgi:hypothetical protein